MGDSYIIHTTKQSPKKAKKKKRGGSKKKMTTEQIVAFKSVSEWVFLDQAYSLASTAASCVVDDFGVQKNLGRGGEKVVFELHSHSKCSDGFLSPSKLVERAHGNGVSSAYICILFRLRVLLILVLAFWMNTKNWICFLIIVIFILA